MLSLKALVAVGIVGWMLAACKPAAPPPDIIQTQREALNKAKAVEGVLQQSEDRTKAAEEGQK